MLEGEVSANDPLVSVVDDDASMRNSTCRLIRSFGILDVRMSGMSGLELQRKLTESGHRFPVIFVTAYGNGPEEEQAMRSGASDFLRKPVSERALINAIEVALRRKLQNGESGNS